MSRLSRRRERCGQEIEGARTISRRKVVPIRSVKNATHRPSGRGFDLHAYVRDRVLEPAAAGGSPPPIWAIHPDEPGASAPSRPAGPLLGDREIAGNVAAELICREYREPRADGLRGPGGDGGNAPAEHGCLAAGPCAAVQVRGRIGCASSGGPPLRTSLLPPTGSPLEVRAV